MIPATGRSLAPGRVHLPDLGRRGEGWVALQVLLLVAILGAGFLGPLWSGPARPSGRSPGWRWSVWGSGWSPRASSGFERS